MAYKATISAQNFLRRINNRGKEAALTTPEYRPALERVLDPVSTLLLFGAIPAYLWVGTWAALTSAGAALVLFSLRELFVQDDHAITRIYGPLGRLRYIAEDLFRDKYLQYFNETNTNGRPIPKIVRDYVYQKAHRLKPYNSFGTEVDIFDPDNTTGCRILHRNFPGQKARATYEVVVGDGRPGIRPFPVRNTINVSAMSFGSINEKAAECLSIGAKGVAYVNTGEGGFGPHGVAGNDVVFQLGTGKFGAGRNVTMPDGSSSRALDDELLRTVVRENPHIGMIQLKISQGAKPGLGGHLPGDKVTPDIAAVRRVPVGQTVISPPQHVEVLGATPRETIEKLFDLIDRVRSITELPVGIKFCVGNLREVDLLVLAMQAGRSRRRGPDAIQIDGADGGTGAGPNIWVNYVGYGGAVETTAYLDARLKEARIRDRVTLSASGRILTPAHAALAFAFGADIIDTARGAMLALGCIQSLRCHTNHCPTGIATNSAWRMHGLNVPEKATRVHHYLSGFHEDMLLLTDILGRSDPRDIRPDDLRIMTSKSHFVSNFEDDPFGVTMPMYRGDTLDAALDRRASDRAPGGSTRGPGASTRAPAKGSARARRR